MKHFVVYTLARLSLFVTCWFAIWAVGRGIFEAPDSFVVWSLILGAVLSSLLSLRLLAGPRERFAQSVQARAERASAAFEERKTREDLD